MVILSLGIAAALFALLERSPCLRFGASPLFRRHFGTDVIYLLTGFVAGGSLLVPGLLGVVLMVRLRRGELTSTPSAHPPGDAL